MKLVELHPSKNALVVQAGSLIAYRTFDACDSVALMEAERLLRASRAEPSSVRQQRPSARAAGAMKQHALPVTVELGRREVESDAGSLVFFASARIFDYGTISMSFELRLSEPLELSEIGRLAAELEASDTLSELAVAEYERITAAIGSALRGRHPISEIQRYVAVCVRELGSGSRVSDLLAWPELPKLLANEEDARPVSAQEKEDALKYTDAYLDDDVVVIGSACALVVEPGGSREVIDVLELVRAQMAQLSHYDDLLDRELEAAYRDCDRGPLAQAVSSHFGSKLRRLSRRRLELTEFTERIDSALKILSDAYLARVYKKALERFGMPALKSSVAHKQRLLLDIYTSLKDEVSLFRSFTLEVLIVLLIVMEVALALASH